MAAEGRAIGAPDGDVELLQWGRGRMAAEGCHEDPDGESYT